MTEYLAAAVVIVCAVAAACGGGPAQNQAVPATTAVVYEGARLIAGDGTAPVEQGAFVVEDGRITAIGAMGGVAAPAGATQVDLSGKTVMPALIGAHGHVGYQKGATFLRENYTRDNIRNDLARAAYFGLATVMTLGIDTSEHVYALRDETAAGTAGIARLRTAGTGIGGPNAGPGNTVYSRGVAYEAVTEDDGRNAVRELAPHKPDLVKIWLDDRGGRGQKLRPEVVKAIVEEAGTHGLKVIAHVRGHADAEVAVQGGVYALAHLARDREMDDALVAAIVQKGIYVTPTLSMAERNNYAGAVPEWLEEPFLKGLLTDSLAPEALARLRASFVMRDPKDAAESRESYGILHRTVTRLHAAGARLVLGGDTGLPEHFWGLAEHRELELLVAAGLTPMQALVAGTSRAAAFLNLPDLGTLAPGKTADFLVLDANPLDDIRHTRRIRALYMAGAPVDRAALRKRWAPEGATN